MRQQMSAVAPYGQLRGHGSHHIVLHMKRFLVELDDRTARELERVAPAKSRKRAEFVRLAIRRAIDLALDRETVAAYAVAPLEGAITPADLVGWDEQNALAKPAKPAKPEQVRPRQKRVSRRAA